MSEFKKLQAEIAELQKRAEAARRAERASAIKTINELIATFEILPAELALPKQGPGRKSKRTGSKSPKTSSRAGREGMSKRKPHPSAGKKVPPKYADDKGNTWAGRGQTPKWLAEALANGATLEQFRVAQPAS